MKKIWWNNTVKQEWRQRRAIDNNKWLEYNKLYTFFELTAYCVDDTIYNVLYK